MARSGHGYDAWYIIGENLSERSIVYSCGVGEDISFDVELVGQFGLVVHAFDPTPKSVEWVSRQPTPERLVLHPYGVSDRDGYELFYPPHDPSFVSFSTVAQAPGSLAVQLRVKRIGTIMRELGHSAIDILKLDIEGSEYRVISDVAHTGIRPKQLLVEFHHHLPMIGVVETVRALRTIRRMGYSIFWISDTGNEFSFLRTRSGKGAPPSGQSVRARLNGLGR